MEQSTPAPFETITRAEGLARMQAFAPRMGRAYAARRNEDLGPGHRDNVSGLSPFLRRRLVTEDEAVDTALTAHGLKAAEKFVQEVVWRTYFKGWLEHRPGVWRDYRDGLAADIARLETDPALRADVEAATAGRTGLAPFDAWARELVETGYLHNHARMWFASIWIFTLRLPWRLGADFFLRHLLDGDPASNTLGWRWVGGLHTPGKTYLARSSNITRQTGGRFGSVHGLAGEAPPLDDTPNPPRAALRQPRAPAPGVRRIRLITEEDGHPESLPPLDVAGTLTLRLSRRRSPLPVAAHVLAADAQALADAATRAGGAVPLDHPEPEHLVEAARRHDSTEIVTAFVPMGWVRDWLDEARPTLDAAGIALAEQQRPWDSAFWPHATAGFFKVKKAIPGLLASLRADPRDLPLFAAAEQR